MAQYNRMQENSSDEGPIHWLSVKLLAALNYIKAHQKNFILGGVLFVIILASLIGWSLYIQSVSHKASILYSQAIQEKDSTKKIGLFKDVVLQYPNSSSAQLARVSLSKENFAQKNYDQVIADLEPVTHVGKDMAFLRILAFHNIATAYEMKGDWEKAIVYYQKAVADSQNRTQDLSRYHLARAYENSGNKKQAREFYQGIRDDTQNQQIKDLAVKRLVLLEKK